MVKITSPAPCKEHKHILRKESLIEVPLEREGRVYSSTTNRGRVHHTSVDHSHVPRCLLWIIMALSACSLTFMGVRTVGTLRMRVNDMAKRIDVLRAEKAYLETLVGEKMTKPQFLAKTYTSQDILSFVDQEPEPFTDKWSFNINVVWTSDYITYCNMYWLSRNIANRIYDKVIQVPRVILVVEEEEEVNEEILLENDRKEKAKEEDEIMEEVNNEIALENEINEETREDDKLYEVLEDELSEDDKLIDEYSEAKEVLENENIGSGDEMIADPVDNIFEKFDDESISGSEGDMIAGANGEDLNLFNI